MNVCRRQFIKAGLGALGMGFASRFNPSYAAFPTSHSRSILNLMLKGGPDLRHLIMPVPDNDFGRAFWSARAGIYGLSPESASQHSNYFTHHYDLIDLDGTRVGVLKRAGWLKDMMIEGHVALVSNVLGCSTRNHSHCILSWQAGDSQTLPGQFGRDGWGGRISALSGHNVLSVSSGVELFCNGPSQREGDHDNSHVMAFHNFERAGFGFDLDWKETDTRRAMFLSIRNYYASKRQELKINSPFFKLLSLEKNLRDNSDAVVERIRNGINPGAGFENSTSGGNNPNGARRPQAFHDLILENGLGNRSFLTQCLNAYYGFACQDLLSFNTISMEYGGWDSHKAQADPFRGIEPKLEDIFGKGKGFSTLWSSLERDMPQALDQTVFVIGGEFGRQLLSNGDRGTDHGRGNYMILIGKPLKGGVYGQTWRPEEIPRMSVRNADIEGLTAQERVLSRLADWIEPGLGIRAFPGADQKILEAPEVLQFLA